MPGSGAAGGLAGGLAALGATLRPGSVVIAEDVGLDAHLAWADWVFTGEGCVDASSWEGKIVGELVRRGGPKVRVIAGQVRTPRPGVFSLQERYGEACLSDTARCLEREIHRILADDRTRRR